MFKYFIGENGFYDLFYVETIISCFYLCMNAETKATTANLLFDEIDVHNRVLTLLLYPTTDFPQNSQHHALHYSTRNRSHFQPGG